MGNFVRTLLFAYMETICCELFVGIFGERRKRWNFWSTGISYSLVCCFNTIFVQLLRENQVGKILFIVWILTLFMWRRYQMPILKCFLAVSGYISIVLACDLAFMIIWETIFLWRWEGTGYREVYITLITVITKTIEFLLFAWLSKKFSRNRVFGALDGKGWTRFLIYSLLTIVALIILWADDGYGDLTVMTISFGLMLLNVMFYFTMWDIVKKERQNQGYRLAQEKAKGQIRLYENMEIVYEEQRKRVHEFKNHLGCIRGLLENGEPDEAFQYLNTIQQKLGEQDSPIKTGNRIIDTIINLKYRQAVSEDTVLIMSLDKMQNFPLDDEDTVVLLSNLLDNALEACRKIEEQKERIIKLKLTQRKGKYVLMVSNRTEETITIEEQLIETTKDNIIEHGIGMHNIRDIIQKYHAEGECKSENGWFTYTIIL